MRALALATLLFSLHAMGADSDVVGTESRWTGGVTLMWGEAGPHAAAAPCCLPSSLDGYGELGRKLGGSVALLAVAVGEYGLIPNQTTHLASGGLAVKLIGDRLGGLSAPIELTLGAGMGRILEGTSPLENPTYGMMLVDTVFPVTRYFRLHSQLIEHMDLNTGSTFLTAAIGLGLTFE
jgi:hypothetical protein